MKPNTSMDLINCATNTVVIGSECGHGLQGESEPTKRCSKCGQYKPLSDFNKNKKAKDGLQYECRECHAITMKSYHVKKAEEILAKQGESIATKHTSIGVAKIAKVYSDPELAKFTPRQLMEELKARGFKWDYMIEPQRKVYFDKI